MNGKQIKSLIHDINGIFDCVVYELIGAKNNWYEIHLKQGYKIAAPDFPHLLVIASGYNVRVEIFPVYLNQLGIIFREEL